MKSPRLRKFSSVSHKQSLKDFALSELRAALMNGELCEGELYSAVALAQTMEVSTTPVREALLDLSREGLVVAEKNRGFRVAEIVETDLDLLGETRAYLEVPLLRKVHARSAGRGFEDLRQLAARIALLTAESDRYEFVQLDRRFHLSLLERAENPFALEVIADFRNRSRLAFLRRPHNQEEVEKSAAEHFDLLACLEQDDVERAQNILRLHILGNADGPNVLG